MTKDQFVFRHNDKDSTTIVVDMGQNVSSEAARWWAAVLASGQGWEAYISAASGENNNTNKNKLLSP